MFVTEEGEGKSFTLLGSLPGVVALHTHNS